MIFILLDNSERHKKQELTALGIIELRIKRSDLFHM